MSTVFTDQDNELDNFRSTDIDSVTSKRYPNSNFEFSTRKAVDDSEMVRSIRRFNQVVQNYHKNSFGNDAYVLTKYDKQFIDTTLINYPNH